jgi:anti-sigma regulatory factor (Ser/Thr protein kinase)
MGVLQRSYRAVAESVGLARRDVREYVRARGGEDAVVGRVALAVSEAVTNVVLHAYLGRDEPGEVRVVAEVLDDAGESQLRVSVEDDGRGMVPRLDSPGAGMGLPIIGQSSDRYEVRTSLSGGNELSMLFVLGRAHVAGVGGPA